MAVVQEYRNSSDMIESVYSIIRSQSGKVRSKDLDEILGNKQEVRFAITRLTVQGRIKRVRGFGTHGIEYFYKDIMPLLMETSRRQR